MLAEETRKIMLGMAFTRDRWIAKFFNTFKGALGEYAKIKYAKALGMEDYWSDEVKALMHTVNNLFKPNVIKTKTKFNLYKAAAEGFLEVMNEQKQITDAKNEFLSSYLSTSKERIAFQKTARELNLNAEDLSFEILTKYLNDHVDEILEQVQVQLD